MHFWGDFFAKITYAFSLNFLILLFYPTVALYTPSETFRVDPWFLPTVFVDSDNFLSVVDIRARQI